MNHNIVAILCFLGMYVVAFFGLLFLEWFFNWLGKVKQQKQKFDTEVKQIINDIFEKLDKENRR